MGIVIEKTEPGPFGEKFVHPRYNEYYIQIHAKSGCHRCRGTGKIHFDNPSNGITWVEACNCLFK